MTDTCDRKPTDPRVERLVAWLRQQGDDAPGLLEAAAKVIGFDALLVPHGDLQRRLHRLGQALAFEIGRIGDACTGRRPYCTAAALREIEKAVAALWRTREAHGRGERHPMADYATFADLADRIVEVLSVAERDAYQRAWLVTGARALIADIEEALVRVEDADPTWPGWASMEPPRGTVFDRGDFTTSTSATSSPRTRPR